MSLSLFLLGLRIEQIFWFCLVKKKAEYNIKSCLVVVDLFVVIWFLDDARTSLTFEHVFERFSLTLAWDCVI